MDKKKPLTGYFICPNCENLVKKTEKINNWAGWKIRDGHVFCKTCSKEIK